MPKITHTKRVVLPYYKSMRGELEYAKQVYVNGKTKEFKFIERAFIFVVQIIGAQYHRRSLITNVKYEKLFDVRRYVESRARKRFYAKRDDVKNSM